MAVYTLGVIQRFIALTKTCNHQEGCESGDLLLTHYNSWPERRSGCSSALPYPPVRTRSVSSLSTLRRANLTNDTIKENILYNNMLVVTY